jgi:hypothetical protein
VGIAHYSVGRWANLAENSKAWASEVSAGAGPSLSLAHLHDTFSLSVTQRPRLRSLASWLDVSPQTAIPHGAHKNIVTAVVYTADLRSTLS